MTFAGGAYCAVTSLACTLGMSTNLPEGVAGETRLIPALDSQGRPTFASAPYSWYVRFNSNIDWADGKIPSAYDMQSVATHELGHAILLMDLFEYDSSWSSTTIPTMWWYIMDGSIGPRTLASGDISGVRTLY